MAKVFLTCFSPFNPKDRPFSCQSSSGESATLFTSLICDLEKSLLEEESISLKWCMEAMLLIKRMHSHFIGLFSDKVSQVSGSWERVEMVEAYLKESLDLLDLCNLLKSAVSGIDRQRSMSEIQKWNEKGLSKMMKMTVKGSEVESAIAIVSLMVFCSVLKPKIPIKIDKVCSRLDHQKKNAFLGCIRRLVCCFLEKMGNAAVVDFEGLEGFKSVVDEVFDEVIQGRNKVLALIALDSSGLKVDG